MTKLIKILMVFSTVLITFGLAENSTKLTFTGITESTLLQTNKGDAFKSDGRELDTANVEFKGKMDSIEAYLKFGLSGAALVYKSAYLKVNDLLDGMIDLRMFNIGNSAGKDSSILIDKSVHGLHLTVKPTDLVSIGVGYGIGNHNFLGNSSRATYNKLVLVNGTNKTRVNVTEGNVSTGDKASDDYHSLKLSADVNLDVLPFSVYFGAALANRDRVRTYNITGGTGDLANLSVVNTNVGSIALMQGGLSADLLAAMMPGALKLDVGASFGGYATEDLAVAAKEGTLTNSGKTKSTKSTLNMVAILHGGVSDLVEGMGLDYYAHYSLDTASKHKSLGDVDDDFFKEMVKVKVTPSYSLGQLKFSLGLGLGMVGPVAALHYDGYTKAADTGVKVDAADAVDAVGTVGAVGYKAAVPAVVAVAGTTDLVGMGYNKVDIDPSVTWSLGDSSSVKFYYNADMILGADKLFTGNTAATTSTAKSAGKGLQHKVGMQVDFSIGMSSEE